MWRSWMDRNILMGLGMVLATMGCGSDETSSVGAAGADQVMGVILPGDGRGEAVWVLSSEDLADPGGERDEILDAILVAHGVGEWGYGARGWNPWEAARGASAESRVGWSNAANASGTIEVVMTSEIGADLMGVEVPEGSGILAINGQELPVGGRVVRAEIWRERARGSRDSVVVGIEGCEPPVVSIIEHKMLRRRPVHWRWSTRELFLGENGDIRAMLRSEVASSWEPWTVEVDTVIQRRPVIRADTIVTRRPLLPADRHALAERIYFKFDRANITTKYQSVLERKVRILKDNYGVTIAIEGHTDKIGRPSYNESLGMRRAETVRHFLASRGLQSSRFSTVSHGERVPRVRGRNREAWAQNRRVEFRIRMDTTMAVEITVDTVMVSDTVVMTDTIMAPCRKSVTR